MQLYSVIILLSLYIPSNSNLFTRSFLQTLSKGDLLNTSSDNSKEKRTHTDKADLNNRRRFLDEKIQEINNYISSRTAIASSNAQLSLPRLLRLCGSYELSTIESELMHVLVIAMGSRDAHVLNAFSEEDYLRRVFNL